VTEAHIAEAGPDGPERPRRRSRAEREEAPRPPGGWPVRAAIEVQLSKQVPNGEPKAEPEHEHRHANEPAHPRKGLFGRAADFLRASYAELRRVQWPDRRHGRSARPCTLGFVVVAGAYLGLPRRDLEPDHPGHL
jgi:preprotein translocase subunit SecE